MVRKVNTRKNSKDGNKTLGINANTGGKVRKKQSKSNSVNIPEVSKLKCPKCKRFIPTVSGICAICTKNEANSSGKTNKTKLQSVSKEKLQVKCLPKRSNNIEKRNDKNPPKSHSASSSNSSPRKSPRAQSNISGKRSNSIICKSQDKNIGQTSRKSPVKSVLASGKKSNVKVSSQSVIKQSERERNSRGEKRSHRHVTDDEDENPSKKRRNARLDENSTSRGARSKKPTAKASEWLSSIQSKKVTSAKKVIPVPVTKKRGESPSVSNKKSTLTNRQVSKAKKPNTSKPLVASNSRSTTKQSLASRKNALSPKQAVKTSSARRSNRAALVESKVTQKQSSPQPKLQNNVKKSPVSTSTSRRSQRNEVENPLIINEHKIQKRASKSSFTDLQSSNKSESVIIVTDILNGIVNSIGISTDHSLPELLCDVEMVEKSSKDADDTKQESINAFENASNKEGEMSSSSRKSISIESNCIIADHDLKTDCSTKPAEMVMANLPDIPESSNTVNIDSVKDSEPSNVTKISEIVHDSKTMANDKTWFSDKSERNKSFEQDLNESVNKSVKTKSLDSPENKLTTSTRIETTEVVSEEVEKESNINESKDTSDNVNKLLELPTKNNTENSLQTLRVEDQIHDTSLEVEMSCTNTESPRKLTDLSEVNHSCLADSELSAVTTSNKNTKPTPDFNSINRNENQKRNNEELVINTNNTLDNNTAKQNIDTHSSPVEDKTMNVLETLPENSSQRSEKSIGDDNTHLGEDIEKEYKVVLPEDSKSTIENICPESQDSNTNADQFKDSKEEIVPKTTNSDNNIPDIPNSSEGNMTLMDTNLSNSSSKEELISKIEFSGRVSPDSFTCENHKENNDKMDVTNPNEEIVDLKCMKYEKETINSTGNLNCSFVEQEESDLCLEYHEGDDSFEQSSEVKLDHDSAKLNGTSDIKKNYDMEHFSLQNKDTNSLPLIDNQNISTTDKLMSETHVLSKDEVTKETSSCTVENEKEVPGNTSLMQREMSAEGSLNIENYEVSGSSSKRNDIIENTTAEHSDLLQVTEHIIPQDHSLNNATQIRNDLPSLTDTFHSDKVNSLESCDSKHANIISNSSDNNSIVKSQDPINASENEIKSNTTVSESINNEATTCNNTVESPQSCTVLDKCEFLSNNELDPVHQNYEQNSSIRDLSEDYEDKITHGSENTELETKTCSQIEETQTLEINNELQGNEKQVGSAQSIALSNDQLENDNILKTESPNNITCFDNKKSSESDHFLQYNDTITPVSNVVVVPLNRQVHLVSNTDKSLFLKENLNEDSDKIVHGLENTDLETKTYSQAEETQKLEGNNELQGNEIKVSSAQSIVLSKDQLENDNISKTESSNNITCFENKKSSESDHFAQYNNDTITPVSNVEAPLNGQVHLVSDITAKTMFLEENGICQEKETSLEDNSLTDQSQHTDKLTPGGILSDSISEEHFQAFNSENNVDIKSSEHCIQLPSKMDDVVEDSTDIESMQCNSETPSSNRMSVDDDNCAMDLDPEEPLTYPNTYEVKVDNEMSMEVS